MILLKYEKLPSVNIRYSYSLENALVLKCGTQSNAFDIFKMVISLLWLLEETLTQS